MESDYDRLLSMQRLSWTINFPGRPFSEVAFRLSLESATTRGDVYAYEEGEGRELVGWLWLGFSQPQYGHIRHIQVEQAHWGKGLGRRIMQDAIDLCAQRGRRRVTLTVTKSNARAMALYERLGFVPVEDLVKRQRMALDL